MMNKTKCFFAVLAAIAPLPALADAVPYPFPGKVAPEVPTYAATSGGIRVTYYGSTAAFTDSVSVYDVQTKYSSGAILDNKSTVPGTDLMVGTGPGQINSGDQLIFYINSPDGRFASIASYSADGVNHAYITSYSGGTINDAAVPAGLFVGLEDLVNGASDFNYNDDDFIFSGVSAPSVNAVTPEPTSLALFGTGLLGAMGAMRRRMPVRS